MNDSLVYALDLWVRESMDIFVVNYSNYSSDEHSGERTHTHAHAHVHAHAHTHIMYTVVPLPF